MGNIQQFGYKITKISELSFLNLLSLKQNLNINEYVYFITKINNKHVIENISNLKSELKQIKEISLYNILTNKIFIIKDNVESAMFFNGIELNYEQIPIFENVIKICNILNGSNASALGLNSAEGYLVLSTKNSYIMSMDRLELEINANNANFIIYNIDKDKIKFYEFEKYRVKNILKLGFECLETSIKNIKFIDLDNVDIKSPSLNKAQLIQKNSTNESKEDKEINIAEKNEIASQNNSVKESIDVIKPNENFNKQEIIPKNEVDSIEKDSEVTNEIKDYTNKYEIDSQENLNDSKTNENSGNSMENEGITLKKKFNTFDNLSKYLY